MDPIYFQSDLRVGLQQIGIPSPDFLRDHGVTKRDKTHDAAALAAAYAKFGWKGPHIHPGISDCLFDRSDDYCSVAYWYQRITDAPLPPIPASKERTAGIERQSWETG